MTKSYVQFPNAFSVSASGDITCGGILLGRPWQVHPHPLQQPG
jgi:hypothetical protein